MWLSMRLFHTVWIVSISTFLCSAVPLSSGGKWFDSSLTGTSIHSPIFIEPAESYESKGSEEENDDGIAGDVPEDEVEKDGDDDDEESVSTDGPSAEPFTDFDDSDDLDALAKGILGSNDNKESVVPCFGTWWPSSGGYVYYYEDYGTGSDDGDSDYSDYNRRRRNRRTRRRRARRNRSKRARSSKKAAKKKA